MYNQFIQLYKLMNNRSERPPSRNDAARKLLDAAREMLGETGISGLRLREVAKRARVNLGMFHYHFGSKERFTRRLLQEIYEEFFGRLSFQSHAEGDPVERLRSSLLVFGRFARDQRQIAVSLLSEALQGQKNSISYLEANLPRHFRVVGGLIVEGQKAGKLKPLPIPVAVSFALGAMGAPNLIIAALERGGRSTAQRHGGAWRNEFLSDRAIERRAELVLSALKI
jgi:AcrR family transcriptional regulator